MSRRGWALFAPAAVLWGIPYLLIKVAVDELAPSVVVFGRTALAALLLYPLALRARAFRTLAGHFRPLLAVALVEVTAPFLLIAGGERYVSSSLAGLLIAAVPLVAALLALRFGVREALGRARLTGLLIGISGVAVLLGVDVGADSDQLFGAAMLLGAAFCYAAGALLIGRYFAEVPPLGVVTAMLALTTVLLAPIALLQLPESMPSGAALASVIALAVASTAAGLLVFFALVAEAGASRATVVTYVNPAVAVALGVAVLGEPFTVATAGGFALILVGSWLATGGRLSSARLRRKQGVP